MYFKVYRSQAPVIEQAIDTAALMLGSDKTSLPSATNATEPCTANRTLYRMRTPTAARATNHGTVA